MKNTHANVERRNDEFTQRPVTRIWQEQPADDNPYVAENCACHGYDLLELMQKRSFVDMFFLLFKGELPSADQAQLLEKLMIGLINPGPRHPAGRAAMCAGVGKTNTAHILPIALSTLSGEHLGAAETEAAMRFLRDQRGKDPDQTAEALIAQAPTEPGDRRIAPGFGSRFGSIDRMPQKIAAYLATLPGAGKTLKWGDRFAQALNARNMGWLAPGVAAAVFVDLGLHPRSGAGLFQLLHAPGLFAHGLELANKPLTAMPFIKDEDYAIED